MNALKIHYFLFLAVFMLAAKPFIGFHALQKLNAGQSTRICVKAFTKRKQEYVEGSNFDISTIQKRLANPLLALTVLFSSFLISFFPSLFKSIGQVTAGILNAIRSSLFPSLHLYLLSGKLTI